MVTHEGFEDISSSLGYSPSPLRNEFRVQAPTISICKFTEMQENLLARLHESSLHQGASHAT